LTTPATHTLRLREKTLELRAGRPIVMGILNIGTDSVADSRTFAGVEEQIERGRELARAGALVVDVGVLSGRTDTAPIPVAEEARRLRPVVDALVHEGVIVSVDAWRPRAIEVALEAGAQLINDTSGLRHVAVAEMAAATGAGLVVMHTRAEPKRAHFPGYADPVADVLELLRERIALARSHGVDGDQLLLDPGLDYAKQPQESLEVLRRLRELQVLERPLLLAVSRKYFIGMLADAPPEERLAGTIAAIEFGVSAGARVVRVHDVAQVSQYLRLRAALYGDGEAAMLGRRDDERLKWIAPKNP
jgi:dihydropteroate synthase